MKDRPHGASVVPTVAVDDRDAPRGRWACSAPQAVRRGAPVRMGQHARRDVGEEHRREHQQQVLDAVEAAAQNQQRDDRPPPAGTLT